MGSKTWLSLSVLSFACAALVGCNNPDKKRDTGTWNTPTPLATNKGGAPTAPQPPNFPSATGVGAQSQPFAPVNNTSGANTNTGLTATGLNRAPTANVAPAPYNFNNPPPGPAPVGNPSPFSIPGNPAAPAPGAGGLGPNLGPNLGPAPVARPQPAFPGS